MSSYRKFTFAISSPDEFFVLTHGVVCRLIVVIIISKCMTDTRKHQETKNSLGDEIANVNSLYDDLVHVLQNTIDSCINSATDRRNGYV